MPALEAPCPPAVGVRHHLAALAVGYPSPVLRFSGVDPGPGADVPLGATGWVALTGPLATAALALAAEANVMQRPGLRSQPA
jgi:hypothetical protein